jgi:MraZ protein
MFLGTYTHNLDDKGRLMIPARFRELLVGGAFITQGFDRCLMVMTSSYFTEFYRRLNEMNMADPTIRMLRRQMLANAYGVEIDKVGRILMPANLRQIFQLEGEAMLVGQGDYFEIWSPSDWNTLLAQLQDTDTTSQRYAALNLPAHA